MSEGQFFGLSIAAIIGGFFLLIFIGLLLGALCMHWAVKGLKFKKPRFKTAFLANALVIFIPGFFWGGALFAGDEIQVLESVVFTVASLVSFFVSVAVVKTMYGVSFGKAVVALVLSRIIWVALGLVVVLIFVSALVALGVSDSIPWPW